MAKNIVYFGELDLFSETIKKMAKIEGFNFYDFPSWEECGEQLISLEANFIFIDLDSIDRQFFQMSLNNILESFFEQMRIPPSNGIVSTPITRNH